MDSIGFSWREKKEESKFKGKNLESGARGRKYFTSSKVKLKNNTFSCIAKGSKNFER